MPAAPSLWQLVGVETEAFARRERRNAISKVALMAGMLVALGAFERRVHSSGQAVCLLAPRWPRLAIFTAGGVVGVGIIGALSPALGGAVLALTALAFLPLAVRAAIALPATRRLHRIGPPGRHLYVHSVASTRAGAGAELLGSLAVEADEKGWLLALDAGNASLETYYSRFGFTRGGAVRMPDGRRQVRMWRPPQGQSQDRGRRRR